MAFTTDPLLTLYKGGLIKLSESLVYCMEDGGFYGVMKDFGKQSVYTFGMIFDTNYFENKSLGMAPSVLLKQIGKYDELFRQKVRD